MHAALEGTALLRAVLLLFRCLRSDTHLKNPTRPHNNPRNNNTPRLNRASAARRAWRPPPWAARRRWPRTWRRTSPPSRPSRTTSSRGTWPPRGRAARGGSSWRSARSRVSTLAMCGWGGRRSGCSGGAWARLERACSGCSQQQTAGAEAGVVGGCSSSHQPPTPTRRARSNRRRVPGGVRLDPGQEDADGPGQPRRPRARV